MATDPEVIEQLRVWAVEFVEAAKEASDRARLNPPRNQLMSAAMLACPDARNWRQVIVPLFSSFLWTLGTAVTKITTRRM